VKTQRRTLEVALVALGLVGLLVVVGIGARAGHPFGRARLHQREVPARVGNDLFTIVVILYGIAAAVFIVALLSLRKEEWHRPESHWIRNLFTSLAILLAFSFVAYQIVRVTHHHGARTPAQRARGSGQGRPFTLPNRPAPKKPAHFDWEFAAALGGLAVLAAAFLAARARREEEPDQESDGRALEHVLAQVVRETIDDLRGEVDPRRAVIAAYARMERILAREGYARRPSETPYEYLERVLIELRVAPDAVRELTDLFELAKFSPHAIGEEVRERALDAFVAVRDDLKVFA
jgi:hypothetical protein